MPSFDRRKSFHAFGVPSPQLRSARFCASVASVLVSVLGCGSATVANKRGDMLDRSGVGDTCQGSSKDEDRPFVVSWDSTDTSLFEAAAKRDTVFVHYEGCSMRMVTSCRPESNPGQLGAYGEPTYTSGAVDSLQIEDAASLSANLPLGVAAFGGKVASGAKLRLQYFVSGVAQNSRERIFQNDIKEVPGCESVTHFVQAYNIGAFELGTDESTNAMAGAGVHGAGVQGETSSRESRLGRGGDLKSCQTEAKQGCRVPIRLVLRPISSGARPEKAQAAQVKAADQGSATDTWRVFEARARAITGEATAKLQRGDAQGCVTSLETEPAFDEGAARNDSFQNMYVLYKGHWIGKRAPCLARLGKCSKAREAAVDAARLVARASELSGSPQTPEYLQASIVRATNAVDRECKAPKTVDDPAEFSQYASCLNPEELKERREAERCLRSEWKDKSDAPLARVMDTRARRARILARAQLAYVPWCDSLEAELSQAYTDEASAAADLEWTADMITARSVQEQELRFVKGCGARASGGTASNYADLARAHRRALRSFAACDGLAASLGRSGGSQSLTVTIDRRSANVSPSLPRPVAKCVNEVINDTLHPAVGNTASATFLFEVKR